MIIVGRGVWSVVLTAACLSLGGCGASTGTVSGQVTVDGKAVVKGIIVFAGAEGNPSPVTANIENGRYEVETTVGPKIVQISVPTVVDKKREYDAPEAPFVEITKELLPDRYHIKSELTFEVKGGQNEKDWILTTR